MWQTFCGEPLNKLQQFNKQKFQIALEKHQQKKGKIKTIKKHKFQVFWQLAVADKVQKANKRKLGLPTTATKLQNKKLVSFIFFAPKVKSSTEKKLSTKWNEKWQS